MLHHGVIVHPRTATVDEYSANGWRSRDVTLYDETDMRQSPPYDRNVHFAEFMALVTIRGPSIPDNDMDRIETLYTRWVLDTRKPFQYSPLELTVHDVRRILRSMTPKERRRYNERWLHIVRRLAGDSYFERYGPRIMPQTMVHDMKQRFRYVNQEFQRLKNAQHWLFYGRKNIPYLMVVARHLLYQTCCSLRPHDASELSAGQTLHAWRQAMFDHYSWYFRVFDTNDAAIITEWRVAYIVRELYQKARWLGHVMPWVAYKCFLPDSVSGIRREQHARWLTILRRITRKQLMLKYRSEGHL